MFTTINFADDPFYPRENGICIRHHVEIYKNDWIHLNHSSPENTAFQDIRMCVISGRASWGEPSYHDVLNLILSINNKNEIESLVSGALTTISPFVPQ